MSKTNINTKSNVYIRDKEAFLKELKHFHDTKGLPFRYPVVNGQEIDLYLLHLLVIQRGGLTKLNNQGGWESLLRLLHLPSSCVNGAALLRRIYSNCLERYERTRGPPGRDDDYSLDADDDGRRGRGGGGPRVAQNYSSAAAEAARSTTKVAGPSERLALSLLSPMPNEQDFAVNVCTVLAADTANRLPISTTPHVLDFLLAHAGVYNHPSLRDTIGRSYKEARGVAPDIFWVERAGGGGARELADERKFPAWGPGAETTGAEQLAAQALAAHIALSDRLKDGEGGLPGEVKRDAELEEGDDETDALWVCEQRPEEEVFAPRVAGGARCVLTQRVLQIASIVRSLSFHDENLPLLAKHTTLIRFVLLCANCWVGTLRQSGLDTLGNVSQELVIKDPSTCLLSRHILSTVLSALTSTDRARMLAALELLNKLAQNEANEDVLLRCLEAKVYEAVCSLLTLRDIMLLVSTLECVYALTALGERACEHVARVSGLVHTLVSLVTVEAQSYGPKACILMRVVETVSGAVPAETVPPPPPPAAQVTPPAPPPAPTPSVTHHHHHVPQPVPQAPVPRPVEVPPVAPQQPVAVAQRATTPQPPPVQPSAPITVQQQHAHQQAVQENEQFAQAWLRAAWEPFASTTSGSEAAELYRQYLACCSKVGRKGVIGPMHFPRLVRSVFGGTVGPNTITNSNGEVQQIYIGIRVRAVANRTPPISATGPASPILKAQLTSKAEQMKVQASQGQPAPTPQPHLNQVLEPGANAASSAATPGAAVAVASTNTTLIKHLLAHKVSSGPPPLTHTNDSMLRMQVTQRQNQQRMMGQQHQQPGSMASVIVQANPAAGMEVDPEALIKCTTITSGGVTSTSPQPAVQPDKIMTNISLTPQQISNLLQQSGDDNMSIIQKEEFQQALQNDDGNSQINLKAVQNKMLADLLEKKSNPPVQVIQMAPSLSGQTQAAPTIQIMENGQIIQVQADASDQQVETVIVDSGTVVGDHSYTQEPPSKKKKLNENEGSLELVSSTAANLYAALAASALEDEEDLLIPHMAKKDENTEALPPQLIQVQQQSDQPPVISIQDLPQQSLQIQQPTLQVQQPTLQVQQPTLQVQQPTLQVQQPTLQVQQPTLQVQQPTLQVQQPTLQVQQPTLQVQQMQQSNMQMQQTNMQLQQSNMQMQQSNMQMQQLQQSTLQLQPSSMQMQQTIQVQQPTMQVQQPVLQVQPMDMPMQNTVIQVSQSGQIILQEKPIVSQTQFIQQQPMQLIATSGASQGGLSYIQSNVMQPHKTIIIVQGGGGGTPITLTVNNPGGLDESTLNSLITQASEAITQQHGLSLQSGPGVIQQSQRIIQTSVGQPTVIQTSGILGAHSIKQALMQNPPQLTPSQQPMITSQPVPMKPQLSGQQLVVGGQKQGLVQGGTQQIVMSSQQVDQLMSGAQQILTVGGQSQLVQGELVNGGQQVVSMGAQPQLVSQGRAPTHTRIIQNVVSNAQLQNVPQTVETQGVMQKTMQQQQQQSVKPAVTRQIISRQPVMVGNHKIGEKQTMGTVQTGTTVQDARSTPSPKPKPLLEEQPWMCHWRGCSRVFENASAVFGHAARAHCPASATVETPCLWSDCDRVPRRTFALLNHLHDRHCTTEALKATHAARRHAAAEGDGKSSVALGYPPNAALAALNKHAVDLFNPRELMHRAEASRTPIEHTDDNEGPVTKSIRLTAALILRNIVIYSNTGRRQLRSYEPHLSSIALSSVEASRTIAQVLYDMNNI